MMPQKAREENLKVKYKVVKSGQWYPGPQRLNLKSQVSVDDSADLEVTLGSLLFL